MELNSSAKEDSHYVGVLGQPSQHDPHTLHPKKHDSAFSKVYACRDMLWDHHWEVRNTFYAGFKGALLGVAYASGFGLISKTIPSVVLKKMFRFVRNNNFGHIRIMKDLMTPYALTGFGLGSVYYLYQHNVWENRSNKWLADVLSNALFFQVATAVCVNPGYHVYGMVGGILFGTLKYAFYQSSYFQEKESIGSYTTFGDLSEEERKKQEYKDYIQFLGNYHKVRNGQLVNL
ncbi:hypothetical protein ABPG74_018410 [Tetrahymena malaccensis]